LAGQVLSVERSLNTGNLVEVQSWYRRRFRLRVPLVQAGTVLLVVAAAAAGASAVVRAVAGHPEQPTVAVTRIAELPAAAATGRTERTDTVAVEVTFRGLTPGAVARIRVTAGGSPLAAAAVTAGPDGSASRTLIIDHVPGTRVVTVQAAAGSQTCTATLRTGDARSNLDCQAD
jgi:hypothetical protein